MTTAMRPNFLDVAPSTPRQFNPLVSPMGETTPPLQPVHAWQSVPPMQLDCSPAPFDIREFSPQPQPQQLQAVAPLDLRGASQPLSSPAPQQFMPTAAGAAGQSGLPQFATPQYAPQFAPQQFSPQFSPQFAAQTESPPLGMQLPPQQLPQLDMPDLRAAQQQQQQQQQQFTQQQPPQQFTQQPQQFGLMPQLGMAPYALQNQGQMQQMPQGQMAQGQMAQGQMPQGQMAQGQMVQGQMPQNVWYMPVMFPGQMQEQAWFAPEAYPEQHQDFEEAPRGRRDKRGRKRDEPLPQGASLALRQLRDAPHLVTGDAVLQHAAEFAQDSAGSRKVSDFLTAGPADGKHRLTRLLAPDVLRLSLHSHGCRVVQKALENLALDDKMLLIAGLKGRIVQCIESQHGNHVVQKVIEELPAESVQWVVAEACSALSHLATHQFGCRPFQRILEHGSDEQKRPILEYAQKNLWKLCREEFGNYVVLHVFVHGRPEDRQRIISLIEQRPLDLACHKHGSNVVEKALLEGDTDEKNRIVQAIIGARNGGLAKRFARLAGERFASYVLQRMLDVAEPRLQWELHGLLAAHTESLKKSSHGKHIMDKLNEVECRFRR